MSLRLLRLCLLLITPAAHALVTEPGIIYTPPQWPSALQGDLYRPDGAGPFPVVLVVHGGGWRSGQRDDFYVKDVCRSLVRAGIAAFSVSYRLAPAARYPAPVDDLRQALLWLRQEGPAHALDPARVGAWGYSAGAHLVALLGTLPADAAAAPVRAVVAGGTPADLRVWPDSEMVKGLLGKSLAEAPALWAEASPVTHASPRSAPFYLYHGRLDRLVEPAQAEAMAQALRRAGVFVELRYLEYSGHILAAIAAGSAGEGAVRFLAQHLNPPPAPAATSPALPVATP